MANLVYNPDKQKQLLGSLYEAFIKPDEKSMEREITVNKGKEAQGLPVNWERVLELKRKIQDKQKFMQEVELNRQKSNEYDNIQGHISQVLGGM